MLIAALDGLVRERKTMAMMIIRFCGWLRSDCCSVACRANQVLSTYLTQSPQSARRSGSRRNTTAANSGHDLDLAGAFWSFGGVFTITPNFPQTLLIFPTIFFRYEIEYVSYLRHGVLLAAAVQSATMLVIHLVEMILVGVCGWSARLRRGKTDTSGSASVEGAEYNFYTDTNIFLYSSPTLQPHLTLFCALFPVPNRPVQ